MSARPAIAESGPGFTAGRLQSRSQLFKPADQPHAPASTPGGGFDQQGETPGGDEFLHGGVYLLAGRGIGHHRYPRPPGQLLGAYLVAQRLHVLWGGPDECDARLSAGPGESRVFRQEAVARMNGLDAAALGDGDDLFHIQVGFHRGLPAEGPGFIGHRHVGSRRIGV